MLAAFIFIFIYSFIIRIMIGIILSFPVMWLWNYLMPVIFNLPQLGIFQALGLILLVSLLTPVQNNSSNSK